MRGQERIQSQEEVVVVGVYLLPITVLCLNKRLQKMKTTPCYHQLQQLLLMPAEELLRLQTLDGATAVDVHQEVIKSQQPLQLPQSQPPQLLNQRIQESL